MWGNVCWESGRMGAEGDGRNTPNASVQLGCTGTSSTCNNAELGQPCIHVKYTRKSSPLLGWKAGAFICCLPKTAHIPQAERKPLASSATRLECGLVHLLGDGVPFQVVSVVRNKQLLQPANGVGPGKLLQPSEESAQGSSHTHVRFVCLSYGARGLKPR